PVPSIAVKSSVPLTLVRYLGAELPPPGLMSLTSAVPADVPSVFHSSQPVVLTYIEPSKATKNSVPFTIVNCSGLELASPGEMFLTRTVPAAVPSLFHSSTPFEPSNALKKRMPLKFVRLVGHEFSVPGAISLTRTVPAAVPSLFHSSSPCIASLARKYSVL